MEAQNKQRGGKRDGAGRKKTTAKRITFGASAEVIGMIGAISDKSAFINAAILFYAAHKGEK